MNSTWDSFAYTVAQGAIIDMSFSGDGISVNTRLIKELYGEDQSVDDILNGKVEPPPCMSALYEDIEKVMADYYQAYQDKKKRQVEDNATEKTAADTPGDEAGTKDPKKTDQAAPAEEGGDSDRDKPSPLADVKAEGEAVMAEFATVNIDSSEPTVAEAAEVSAP